MVSTTPLQLKAPAKVNLTLKVLGKREDGYHELETWMQKISLHDTIKLQVTETPGIEFLCASKEVPCDSTNLVWKAAEAVLKHSGLQDTYGVHIELEKKIPVAAGLGGGSSDAGTVLKGLNLLLGSKIPQAELLGIALSLGADVPFFTVDYQAVLARGVGEKMVEVASLPDLGMILVNPGIAVSTKWVFENFVLTEGSEKSNLSPFSEADSKTLRLDSMQNDLEKVTEAKYPIIAEIKSSLLEAGAKQVLMSGSGPTVFGIFPDSNKKCCIEIEDAVNTMRLRFGNKTYKARTSAGA